MWVGGGTEIGRDGANTTTTNNNNRAGMVDGTDLHLLIIEAPGGGLVTASALSIDATSTAPEQEEEEEEEEEEE